MNWTEKYRPKSFSDLTGDRDQIESLRALILSGDIPHLLFYGGAGTGKTTIAQIIGDLICGEYPHPDFIEINASDERGIDKIRVLIQRATRNMSLSGGMKVVFFDECDGLTKDAQELLRRPVEKSSNVLFVFSCNDITQIIQPIKSRCAQYNFELSKEHVIARLKKIATLEAVDLEEWVYQEIAQSASITPKGQISATYDMRGAINELQKRIALFNAQDTTDQTVAAYLPKAASKA